MTFIPAVYFLCTIIWSLEFCLAQRIPVGKPLSAAPDGLVDISTDVETSSATSIRRTDKNNSSSSIFIHTLVNKDKTTTTTTAAPVSKIPTLKFVQNNVSQEIRTEFKACCEDSCVTYNNPMDMISLECCGHAPMKRESKICCSNQYVYEKMAGLKFYDRCCGDLPFGSRQTCCKGKVYEGAGQACCGDSAYQHGQSMICCGDVLHNLVSNRDLAANAACCGTTVYDARSTSEFCCGGKVYNREDNYDCCLPAGPKDDLDDEGQHLGFRATGFQANDQLCCNGVYNITEFDFCCYVFDTKRNLEPTPTPYQSKSQCCTMTGLGKKDTDSNQCVLENVM